MALDSDGYSSSSNADSSEDEDKQLQRLFKEGKLKPGLHMPELVKKLPFNNVPGLKKALSDLKSSLLSNIENQWIERLDLVSTAEHIPSNVPGAMEDASTEPVHIDNVVHDDFQREMCFYSQALASGKDGLQRLAKMGISSLRPDDYFAEMAKSDQLMAKVRKNMLTMQQSLEKSVKARKMRELRKTGKKVQHEVLLKRQREKRELMESVKKYRKGQKDKLDFLNDEPSSKKKTPNNRRAHKDEKYGFGGRKKGSKRSTAESAADFSGFSSRKHSTVAGKRNMNKKNKRPGNKRRKELASKRK